MWKCMSTLSGVQRGIIGEDSTVHLGKTYLGWRQVGHSTPVLEMRLFSHSLSSTLTGAGNFPCSQLTSMPGMLLGASRVSLKDVQLVTLV